MAPTDEQIRFAIAEQAAEWFVAHRTGTLNEAERVAFAGWLTTSPVHVDEYLRMAAISRDLRDAARKPDLPLEAWIAEGAAAMPGTAERRIGRWVSGRRLAWALALPAIAVIALLLSLF